MGESGELRCVMGSVYADGLCMRPWIKGLYDAVVENGDDALVRGDIRRAFELGAGIGRDGNDRFLSDAEAGLVTTLIAMRKAKDPGLTALWRHFIHTRSLFRQGRLELSPNTEPFKG